jgi:hypothetical protein
MRLASLSMVTVAVVSLAAASGCSSNREYVRGVHEPEVDAPAMSTSLDKDDIQRMVAENLNHLRNSPLMDGWRVMQPRPTVGILPFRNETSEHIDSQLSAILSESETWLVESQTVAVVSHERQRELLGEIGQQQAPAFDPTYASRFGKQLGVKYFITGKIMAADERTRGERRVQYLCYMQVLETETGAVRWQRRAYATKMAR